MNSSIYIGQVSHSRHIPKKHAFSYPFFMYCLPLDDLESIDDIPIFFSVRKWAFNRFYRPDYLGENSITLGDAVKQRMFELTGKKVTGNVYGLINLRTCGLYFSPVNFYYGYGKDNELTHFLAEVSNIPWNERHHYCHLVADGETNYISEKKFKVSPFNPVAQEYRWEITKPEKTITISLEVHDARGHIFNASLDLTRHSLTFSSLLKQLLRKPVMTIFIVAGIYWQALKLFLKGIPYIPYQKETT